MEGFFVAVEGLDSSGKSTQIKRLISRLDFEGYKVAQVRSPGGTPVGEKLRDLVLGDEPMSDLTEMFLHVACRAEMWEVVLSEYVASNDTVVVMSRWFDSLIAYQGKGRGFDIPTLYGLKSIIMGSWNPDLTVLLDIPVEHSMRRIKARGGPSDKMEREDTRFYTGVRRQFLDLAKVDKSRYVVINGMLDVDVIERRIWDAVELGMETKAGRRNPKEAL